MSGPRTYRKKPVTVEAVQYDGTSFTAGSLEEWINQNGGVARVRYFDFGTWGELRFEIRTLEGRMEVSAGDWIIRGVVGEFYACRADVFEQTYEQADE